VTDSIYSHIILSNDMENAMKTQLRLCWFVLLATFCTTGTGIAQIAVYSYFEDGRWKFMSSGELLTRTYANSQTHEEQQSLGKTSAMPVASRFKLLFQKDSADAFTPGFFAYATRGGWNAMDDGSSKRAIVMSVMDSSIGRVATTYYSATTFQPLASVVDIGYKGVLLGTETANLQMTNAPGLQHVVFYGSAGGGTTPPLGAIQTRVRSKFSGSNLFTGVRTSSPSTYYYPAGFLDESKTSFDLTGNSLFEIIGIGSYPLSFGSGSRLYIYDNLALIDSVDDNRFSLFGAAYTTCNDVNSDGRPEILVTVSNAPNLFQWNPSARKFQLIGSLGYSKAMWINPENVDGDSAKETIVRGGFMIDTVVVYNASLQSKYRLSGQNFFSTNLFVDNVNTTPNKEIVVTGSVTGTIVFDLSTGTTPVWSDPNFTTLAVGDFRKIGRSELLGIVKTAGFLGIPHLRLVDGTNGYRPVWTRADSGASLLNYAAFIGPHAPTYNVGLDLFSSLFSTSGIARLAAADCNGDGVNDFVVRATDKSFQPLFLVISGSGAILDTLPNVRTPAFALAYDFNGNGRAELLVSQNLPSFSSTPLLEKKSVYVYEYDAATSAERGTEMPTQFVLEQNYPNPFNPATNIRFHIAHTSLVRLKIYDLLGREIASIVNEVMHPGSYKVTWDAQGFLSGVYFYRLQAGDFVETKRLTVLK